MLRTILAWIRGPSFLWIYSGVSRGDRNAYADAGVIRSTRPMTRARAIREVRRIAPNGSVIHVDDVNKIITYRTN